jgi:hypothetical protein
MEPETPLTKAGAAVMTQRVAETIRQLGRAALDVVSSQDVRPLFVTPRSDKPPRTPTESVADGESSDPLPPCNAPPQTAEYCPSCDGNDTHRIARDALDERRSLYQCRTCRWVFFGRRRT